MYPHFSWERERMKITTPIRDYQRTQETRLPKEVKLIEN